MTTQPTTSSASQFVYQSFRQVVQWRASQSLSDSVSCLVSQRLVSLSELVNQSIRESNKWSDNWSVSQSISQSVSQSVS